MSQFLTSVFVMIVSAFPTSSSSYFSLIPSCQNSDVLLGFTSTQFSGFTETVYPHWHIPLPSDTSRVSHMVNVRGLLLSLVDDKDQRLLCIWSFVPPKTSPTHQRGTRGVESTSDDGRGSDSVRLSDMSGLRLSDMSLPRLSDALRPSESGIMSAEQFENGWEVSFNDRLQTALNSKKQGILCNCCQGTVDPICRYGSSYLLCPLIQQVIVHHEETPLSQLYQLPASESELLVLIVNPQGVIENWNVTIPAKIWSLTIYDRVTFIKSTNFVIPLKHPKPVKASRTPYESEESQGSMRSLGQLSPSGVSFPESYQCECVSADMNSSPSVSGSDVTMARLIVIGTERGRLLIVDEKEGRVLFDVNVMDTSLDICVLSDVYEGVRVENDGQCSHGSRVHSMNSYSRDLTGFVLSCVNCSVGIVYSLFIFWDSQSQSIHSNPIQLDPPLVPPTSNQVLPLPPIQSHASIADETASCASNQTRVEVALSQSTNPSSFISHPDTLSFPSSVTASQFGETFSINSSESYVFKDIFVGLFRTDPERLSGAKVDFLEKTAIQDIRLRVRECDENGRYQIANVWNLRGEVDAVTLAQLKLQEDSPVSPLYHSISLTPISVYFSYSSYLVIIIHSTLFSHNIPDPSLYSSFLTIFSSTYTVT